MSPYGLLAPLFAIALTAGFAFIADASLVAKIVLAALLVLSFFIGSPALLWGLAGTLLQVALCIGIAIYFKVAH